jgi:hypothetical protein
VDEGRKLGGFEQNFQSVEDFAWTVGRGIVSKNRWQLGSGFFVALF